MTKNNEHVKISNLESITSLSAGTVAGAGVDSLKSQKGGVRHRK